MASSSTPSAEPQAAAPLPTTGSTLDADRAVTRTLIKSAHTAELAGDYKEAYNLHTRAGNLLAKVIAKGQKKSEERRRDKMFLSASVERRTVLKAAAEGAERGIKPLVGPLPSPATRNSEFENPNGRILLSLIENGTWSTLVGRSGSFEGMEVDENNQPYLTPLLPSPEVVPNFEYHVYQDRQGRAGRCYFNIKDATKTQTLYTLYARRSDEKAQIRSAGLSQATDYDRACVKIDYEPVNEIHDNALSNAFIGRTVTIKTSWGSRFDIKPDRSQKKWHPRSFTYGGRYFVWKDESSMSKLREHEALYEVKSFSMVVGTKSGKREYVTFDRPLAWMDGKSSMDKVCTIGIVGGLDQVFREVIIATITSKCMVVFFGHG